MRLNLRFGQHHIRHDNHNIAFLHQPRRRTVQTHYPTAAFACNSVGLKTFSIIIVDDGDFFVDADTRGIKQVFIYGNAADVVEVGFGNGGAVYLAAEQSAEHGFPFKSNAGRLQTACRVWESEAV
jgi:hypothetical protein